MNLNLNFNYITSMVLGIFIGSIILLLSRIMGLPISGAILAIVLSAFVTSFLYNPSKRKNPTHTTLRGTGASMIFSLIFSIMLIIYYMPRLGSLIGTADMSISVSIGIILLITVIIGLVLGTIGGSIGSTFRDLCTVISSEK